jgi:predicted peptidase
MLEAARALMGKKIALRTPKGLRRGEVEKVDDAGIVLATKVIINREVRGVRRSTVAWTELAREDEDRFAANWRPAAVEGGMARAILALKRKNPDAAEKALASAGAHPLADRIRLRIDEHRLEKLGALAAVAWGEIERKAAKPKLAPEDRMAIGAKLEAFQKKYGRTKFAASAAGKIAALRERLAEGMLAAGTHFLKLPQEIHANTKFLNQEFVFYQPKGVDPYQKMPLLFHLHGISGRGNDIKRFWRGGRPLVEYAEKHKLPMVFPQCAQGDTTKSIEGKPGDGWWQSADLDLLLEYLASTYNIDRDRIYATGFSMGAFGTWAWAIDSPQLIAAAVASCGGGDAGRVGAIKNMPIWAFHGANDTRVPPSRSQVMVDPLKKAGSTKVRFTLQPNTGHSASAFGKPELYEWIVRQSRKGPMAKPDTRILAGGVTKVFIGERGNNQLPYILSVPGDYGSNKNKYPVLVYLHGAAEVGTDLKAVGVPGGGNTFEQWNERFMLIAPQSPSMEEHWNATNCNRVIAIIEYEKKKLRIDASRICITGFSMGAYGTFIMVNQYPSHFSAVATICGAGYYKGNIFVDPNALNRLPFWIVSTAADPIVPVADVRSTVDKLRHRIWKDSFLFDWMYAQKRGTPHNYHLEVVGGNLEKPSNKYGDGFFEPKTVHKITARAPDAAKGEVFAGWTSSAGMGRFWVRNDYPEHESTTHPATSNGRFGNAKALTTTFVMPANDVIVKANYRTK